MHPDERVEVATARLLFAENLQDDAAQASEGKPGSTVTVCFSSRSVVVWGLRLRAPAYDIRQLTGIRRFGDGEVELVLTHRGRPLRRYGLKFSTEPAAAQTVDRLTRVRDELAELASLSGIDPDGIGRLEWAMITDVVAGAASPRVKAFGQAVTAWIDVELNHKRQNLYTLLLTRAACAGLVTDSPTTADVRHLADGIHAYWKARFTPDDDTLLFGNLAVAFDLVDDGSAVAGPAANLSRMVIVGSVLTHPEAELAALRPSVARWVQSHPDFVRDSGF